MDKWSLKMCKEKGFTLIELMVVVVIMGVVFAIAVPNIWGYITSMEINAAVDKMAGNLRACRQLAISKNVNAAVFFDPVAREYIIARAAMPNEASPAATSWQYPLGGTRYYEVASYRVSERNNVVFKNLVNSSTITLPSFTPPGRSAGKIVVFTPRGTANSGTIYLMPEVDVAKNYKGRMRSITIVNTTGRIRIYKYVVGSGTWQ